MTTTMPTTMTSAMLTTMTTALPTSMTTNMPTSMTTSTPRILTNIMPMTMTMTIPMNITCVDGRVTLVGPGDCEFVSNAALVFIILSIVFTVWGLFNNIILLVIIFSNGNQLRTLPNIFIANMAFIGIIFLLVVNGGNLLIFGQVAFQVDLSISDSAAGALLFIQIFVSVASFTILVLLGLDRYVSIVHPLRSRPYRTKKRIIVMNCLVWIIAGICMIPVLVGGVSHNVFEFYSTPASRNSVIIFFTFAFAIPVSLLLVMYIAILKVILFNPIQKHVHGGEQTRRWKRRINVFRTIFRVVFSFMVFYGYMFAIFLWIGNGGHTRVSERLSTVLLLSALLGVYFNTCINPVIYALNQDSFRPFVYKLLCPKRFKLRKPMEGALETSQQNNAGAQTVPCGTPHNDQERVVQTSVGENSDSYVGNVNDGYNSIENGGDMKTLKEFLDEAIKGDSRTLNGKHETSDSLQLHDIEANV